MVFFSHWPPCEGRLGWGKVKTARMKLTAKNTENAKRIEVEHEGELIATIFCDTAIKWQTSAELPVAMVQEVVTIAMNFKLIYYNL